MGLTSLARYVRCISCPLKPAIARDSVGEDVGHSRYPKGDEEVGGAGTQLVWLRFPVGPDWTALKDGHPSTESS